MMSLWAKEYIKILQEGKEVSFHPHGKSMEPVIMNGELVTVEPVRHSLKVGDIVLCRVNKSVYLHFIKEKKHIDPPKAYHMNDLYSYQIGSNKGKINGWISIRDIYGILVKKV